jgi:hypothetical protein
MKRWIVIISGLAFSLTSCIQTKYFVKTENFEKWIRKIVDSEHPSKDIIGYYFGIFESGTKEYTLYLSGSTEFNGEDEDWVCNNDFEPNEKYLPLPQYKNLKWEEVLNEITGILKNFMETYVYKNSFFSKAKAIATGFDGGDLVLIKSFENKKIMMKDAIVVNSGLKAGASRRRQEPMPNERDLNLNKMLKYDSYM